VFQRSVSGGPDQIFGMDDTGHHQVNLTNSTRHETQPVINPTNPNLIAFVSDRTGTHQIFTVDLTNPALPVSTNLSNNAFDDIKPDWSSDGANIVFSSSRSGHSQIWEMTSTGTGQTSLKINDNGLTEIDPAWSPDNSMITFSERGPSAPPSQDIMDTFEVPATSAQTAATPVDLTQSSPARDIEPNWQPIPSTAVVPESPMALLLPASGALLLVGGTLAGRRRRRRPAPMAV
jgi:Tol biopolymer transport system component